MQPRTGKHRPLPGNGGHSTSPGQLPHAPLELGSPPEINNGRLSQAPPTEPSPLQDMSPNVPLLSLSQCISPETKLLGSPSNVTRRLSFSAAIPATAGGFSLQDLTTTTSNKLKDNQLKVDDDGISPLLARIAPPPGCPWVAEFGELADLSKLGSLPSEDDILMKFAEHSAKEEMTTGSELYQHPQKQQKQQEHYLQQPCSYFQREQQPIQQQQQHQMWVPHQSYEKDFAGNPTPLFTPVNDRLPQQQHHMHSSSLQPECQDTGDYPPTSSSSFNPGNVPPWCAATTAAYYSRSKRKAESDLGPATAPPSSLAASRFQNNKQQRQNGRYSGHYSTTFPLSGYQQQPSRNRTTTNAKNKSTHSKSSALLDDFESDDPGANTGRTYRGVSRHRLTQRWEASLWLNGRQLYLGGFDAQIDAAKAYDIAALACKGRDAIINFSAEEYDQQLREIAGFSREEVVAYVRRRSAAFSRGKSKYRGVSGHNGRWEARFGSFNGRKNVSFGVFVTEECAGRQYDRALILEKGRSAKTNFPLPYYEAEVEVYKEYMARACGQLPRGSAAVIREVEAYTLPRNRVATADERKRSAIIYGETLRQALEG